MPFSARKKYCSKNRIQLTKNRCQSWDKIKTEKEWLIKASSFTYTELN